MLIGVLMLGSFVMYDFFAVMRVTVTVISLTIICLFWLVFIISAFFVFLLTGSFLLMMLWLTGSYACTPTDDPGSGHRAAIHCRCPVSFTMRARPGVG